MGNPTDRNVEHSMAITSNEYLLDLKKRADKLLKQGQHYLQIILYITEQTQWQDCETGMTKEQESSILNRLEMATRKRKFDPATWIHSCGYEPSALASKLFLQYFIRKAIYFGKEAEYMVERYSGYNDIGKLNLPDLPSSTIISELRERASRMVVEISGGLEVTNP